MKVIGSLLYTPDFAHVVQKTAATSLTMAFGSQVEELAQEESFNDRLIIYIFII